MLWGSTRVGTTAYEAMSPKITTWKGNLKYVSLPKLPSCEAVGWIKTAALREALDSFLTEAAASQPIRRCIPVCFGAACLERIRAALSCHCVALFGLGRAVPGRDRSRSSPGAGRTSAPHPRQAGREQLCSQGMCASVCVSFWGNEAKYVIASPVPSLPASALAEAGCILCWP